MRDLIQYAANELAPPAFVIIFPRTIDCRPSRHLLPRRVKCALQLLRVEI
jgi:hypothetical protein